MSASPAGASVDRLIQLLSKLPGLGPRSARRAALHLIKKRAELMGPLAEALTAVAETIAPCRECGNLDACDPCAVCADPRRDASVICVIEDVGDLWALERAAAFRGRYHVLGGVLSALDHVTPDDLAIETLMARAARPETREIVLALNATVDGAATTHYLAERLAGADVVISSIARGVPVGGELDYLDDGTLAAALASRRPTS